MYKTQVEMANNMPKLTFYAKLTFVQNKLCHYFKLERLDLYSLKLRFFGRF